MSSLLRIGEAEVDLDARRVRVPGADRRLSAIEARLLAWFVAHPAEPASRERLLREVWAYHDGVRSRTVDTTLGRLRAKVEPDPKQPRYLVTVPGGYRFEPESAPAPAPEAGRTNLRADPTSFLGRVREVDALTRALLEGEGPVTVTGPGGVGKTRLARHVALASLGRWPGGVWALDLLSAADGLASRVGALLGLALPPTDPAALADLALDRPPTLLLLDDAEQALDRVRPVVAALAGGPIRTLVTSRAPLGIPDERVIAVGPLPPDVAVRLLRDRAPDAGHEGLEELARVADGLPLALELCARRLRTVSAGDLARLARVDPGVLHDPDRAGRQSGLRPVFAWSWELLEPGARADLAALAVASVPFTIEAAAAITGTTPSQALERVEVLLRWSLLAVDHVDGETWFRMLVPVRELALEHLAEPERRAAEARWRAWAVQDARAARVTGDRRLDLYVDAARTAPEGPEGVELARACGERLVRAGRTAQGLWLVDGALACGADEAARAHLHLLRGALLEAAGDDGIPALSEAVRLARAVGDPLVEADARVRLARIRHVAGRGDPDLGGMAERALACAEDGGSIGLRGAALVLVGIADSLAGRTDLAEARFREAAALARSVGDLEVEAAADEASGGQARRMGRLLEAEALWRHALALAGRAGDVQRRLSTTLHVGYVLVLQGRVDEAARVLRRAEAEARDAGLRQLEARALYYRAFALFGRGDVAECERLLGEAAARFRRSGDLRLYLGAALHLGRMRHLLGDAASAAAALAEVVVATDRAEVALLAWRARMLRALALADLERHDEARRVRDEAAGRMERSPRALAFLAFVDDFLDAARRGAAEALAELRASYGTARFDREHLG